MSLIDLDLNDEDFLSKTDRNWILGLIRCRLITWNEPDREQFKRTVQVMLEFGGKSKWFAECRAWQAIEEMRLARAVKPALAMLPAVPQVEVAEPIIRILSDAA